MSNWCILIEDVNGEHLLTWWKDEILYFDDFEAAESFRTKLVLHALKEGTLEKDRTWSCEVVCIEVSQNTLIARCPLGATIHIFEPQPILSMAS